MVQGAVGRETVCNRLQPIVDALRSLANDLAGIAQTAERLPCKQEVGGATPPTGSTAEWRLGL